MYVINTRAIARFVNAYLITVEVLKQCTVIHSVAQQCIAA